MVKTPPQIDYNELYHQIASQISNEQKLIDLMQIDIDNFEKKQKKGTLLSFEEQRELSFLKSSIIDHRNKLAAKENVFEEYLNRSIEMAEKEKAERKDYVDNYKTVVKQANHYKNALHIPSELRDHLKQVLRQNTSNFSIQQMTDYYLALKKEVEICKNYRPQ